MLGVAVYGTKQIAAASDVNSTFWNIYAIQLIASLLALIAYVIAVISIPNMGGVIPIILGVVLFSKMIDISWLFAGKEDFKKITLRNTVVKLSGVISIFTLVKSSEDLYLYVFLIVLFDFLGQFVMWVPAKKFIKRPSFNKKTIKKNLHPIVLLFLPQVAISLYVVLDKTLLGILGSYSDVGIYEQGQKLTSILITVVSSLGAVMLPRVANLLSEKKEKEAQNMVRFSFILYNLIIFPMIFGLIAVNEVFVKLFLGENFQDVKYVLYIVVFNIMFIGWTNILGYQVLVARNKNKEFMLSTTIPAFVSVVVNIVVIPFFGYIGASMTSVVVEILVFAIQWYYSRNIINKNLLFNIDLIKIISASLLMFVAIMLCKYMLGLEGIIGLLIYIGVGGITYVIMNVVLRTIKIKEITTLLK
jgi:flippase wzx